MDGPHRLCAPAFRVPACSRLLRPRFGGGRAAGCERAASAAILEQASAGRVWAARRPPAVPPRRGAHREGPSLFGPHSGAKRRSPDSLSTGRGVSATKEQEIALSGDSKTHGGPPPGKALGGGVTYT